ncbi:MAG: HAD-IA family hydrolase [Pseudomonadota bacterium]
MIAPPIVPTPLSAVIFDCDGVLVDSEIAGLKESAAYLKRHGLNWSQAELVERFSGLRDDQFFDLLTRAFRDVHNAGPNEAFFKGLYDQRRLSGMPLEAMPGAYDAVKAIKTPVAVASSSRTDRLEKKLKTTQLWPLFAPHVYSADLVEHGKPAPDIYTYTAKQLGIDPAECLVIEDSVNGVRSGIRAGMAVWGFTGGGHCFEGHGARLEDAGARWVAPSFQALSGRLQGQEADSVS